MTLDEFGQDLLMVIRLASGIETLRHAPDRIAPARFLFTDVQQWEQREQNLCKELVSALRTIHPDDRKALAQRYDWMEQL